MNPDANNTKLRAWLWDTSEKITGIKFPYQTLKPDDYNNNNAYKNRNTILKKSLFDK